jgi:hypothetical protein
MAREPRSYHLRIDTSLPPLFKEECEAVGLTVNQALEVLITGVVSGAVVLVAPRADGWVRLPVRQHPGRTSDD